MIGKDLEFKIVNYKKANADIKLNADARQLITRVKIYKENKAEDVPASDLYEKFNNAEIAFLSAINTAYVALGAASEAQEKIEAIKEEELKEEK